MSVADKCFGVWNSNSSEKYHFKSKVTLRPGLRQSFFNLGTRKKIKDERIMWPPLVNFENSSKKRTFSSTR